MGQAQANLAPAEEQAISEIVDELMGIFHTIDYQMTLSQLGELISLLVAMTKQVLNAKAIQDEMEGKRRLCLECEDEDFTLMDNFNLPMAFFEPLIEYHMALINFRFVTHPAAGGRSELHDAQVPPEVKKQP